MPFSDLIKFVDTARNQKASDEQIKNHLLKAGWSEHDILEVLNPQTQQVNLSPPPVPRIGMWVSFQYILLFLCLYISFTSLAGIFHYAVDKLIKDPLRENNYDTVTTIGLFYGDYSNDWLLKSYIAGIIVTFPIFATLFLILKKQLLEKPAVRNLRARKILIYITLVGTFMIMTGHLISTVYGFLGGADMLRAFAHLGVTFFVAGSIFVYLLNEVKEDRKLHD